VDWKGILMTGTKPKIGFIGAGRVGTTLAMSLQAAGYPVVAVASRSLASAEALVRRVPGCRAYESSQAVIDASDLVFLTTPDDVIRDVAESLRWRSGVAVVHTSGSASRELLEVAQRQGCATGSLHPLFPFADINLAVANLPGSVFAVEAEGEMRALLLTIVADLRGIPMELNAEDKALYHASAAYAASYVVTLLKLATDIWRSFGWERGDALRALLPTLRGTVSNLENVGIPGALTGPISRGDAGTVRRNLAAVRERSPEQVAIYEALAGQAIPISVEKGLSEEAAASLRQLLSEEPALPPNEGARRL
jgi:predicted short-subunit dehydrogenase-like oxidoreductase (DUF2520 family)